MKPAKSTQGFTLIELMIALAIIAILAGMAYPTYVKSMQKTRRADAFATLHQVARLQEEYFIRNRTYANSLLKLGFATETMDTENTEYDVTVQGVPSGCAATAASLCSGFTAIAVPNTNTAQKTAQQQDQDCQMLSLDNLGRKSATDKDKNNSTSKCWR